MQVAHGGADMTMAEQALDGVQVDAGFEQVGGEAVAQGVDAGGVGKTGGIAGGPVHALGGTVAHGAVAGLVGEQPGARTAGLPVQAQGVQKPGREQRITILPAFALAYLEAHAVGGGFDVADLEGADFRDTQAGGVGGHQDGAGAQGGAGTEQALDFVAGEDDRQPLGYFGHGDVDAGVGALEDAFKEKAAGAGGLVDAGVSEFLLLDQVQQVGLDLGAIEPIRGAVVMLG